MSTRVSQRLTTSKDQTEQGHRIRASSAAEAQLQSSQRMTTQRQRVEASFGSAAQLQDDLDEELQMKAAQRMSPEEEELPLQGRFATTQLQGALEEEEPLQAKAKAEPNLTGMPDTLKSGIESLSGMDMSSVRVHSNSDKPAQLNALAYAQGNDIHLAPGQEQHLPHEAWHVVQQRQGRVHPTMELQGVGINDDHSLEHEADVMGSRATSASSQSGG